MTLSIDFFREGLREYQVSSVTCNSDFLYIFENHEVKQSFALKDIYQFNIKETTK